MSLTNIVDGLIVHLNSCNQHHNHQHQKVTKGYHTMNEQSPCLSIVWVVSTKLYGSTTGRQLRYGVHSNQASTSCCSPSRDA